MARKCQQRGGASVQDGKVCKDFSDKVITSRDWKKGGGKHVVSRRRIPSTKILCQGWAWPVQGRVGQCGWSRERGEVKKVTGASRCSFC